jgi:hypothetical protein
MDSDTGVTVDSSGLERSLHRSQDLVKELIAPDDSLGWGELKKTVGQSRECGLTP